MCLSQPDVAEFINREFVPVWESIRPVPKVTVDFGDGRKLERTLAGNTVLSVCLPDGRVVDAMPGVYTAQALRKELQDALELVKGLQSACAAPEEASARVAAWHRERAQAAVVQAARNITFSKAFVESPLLKALGVERPAAVRLAMGRGAEGEAATPSAAEVLKEPKAAFEAISARIQDISKLPASPAAVRAAAGLPGAPELSPEQLGKLAVERDSRNNMALVRPAVHLLFTLYAALPDARTLRDDVYRRVLHVEVDDPYLGLAGVLVPGTPPGK